MDTLNLNVGLLGHVDSGKTSLAKALSQISSTAAFDKDPQAQERGITLDLGFSSFTADFPLKSSDTNYSKVQFTLVDCPGHASLIKTIIGGAHIIDIMILVIDATKGIQPQASECLVLCEIIRKKMIVVVNKSDLVTEAAMEKLLKKLKSTIDLTILKGSPIVTASALNKDVEKVINTILDTVYIPKRNADNPFLFAVDHCFGIRGKGTVLTGTVLQGTVNVNDKIEIPSISEEKKVRSLEMFKKPVDKAVQGDRVGVCVTQFDPKLLERGLACSPGYVKKIYACIMDFRKVRYFTGNITSNSTFHVNVGYENVPANILLFADICDSKGDFSFDKEYKFIREINSQTSLPSMKLYVLLEFSKPILVASESLAIGVKLDAPVTSCRLAFHGHVIHSIEAKNYREEYLKCLKIYKEKCKDGLVDRVLNEHEVIGKNMFKKETNVHKFVGAAVTFATGEDGIIESPFGKTGKFKVRVPDGMTYTFIPREFKESLEGVEIRMHYKRYIFGPKQMKHK